MRNPARKFASPAARAVRLGLSIGLALSSVAARADAVTEWNATAVDIVIAQRLGLASARALAIVQVSVFEAVNAITRKCPSGQGLKLDATGSESVAAAVAAANRAALSALAPAQLPAIEAAYQAALRVIPEGKPRTQGIAVGERAAGAILAQRADDGISAPETYRPITSPGVYIPTTMAIASNWSQRRPWLLARSDQFRPGPPPDLRSPEWARDYNEIKVLGAKNSTVRTAEQTAIARFWEATAPSIYYPLAASIAEAPGREVTRNARLMAAFAQAMDDALIAVFDAKYFYNLWRPITAIRNGDLDGNDATERDPSWVPLIETSPHPEYPCAHCIVSAAVGAILKADVGSHPMPTLSTSSPTAPGVVRSWTSVDDFTQEVAQARIYDGVHYRHSTEVGSAMGKKIGELVAAKYLQ